MSASVTPSGKSSETVMSCNKSHINKPHTGEKQGVSQEPSVAGSKLPSSSEGERQKVSQEPPVWSGGRLSPRVRCMIADNASPLVFIGTNTWIVSEIDKPDCVVIDPGPDSDEHLDAVRAAIAQENLRVSCVVLTHDHFDHADGAQKFADAVGAPLYQRRNETLPDGVLCDGTSGPLLKIVSLPGHSSDSVGIVFPAEHAIFTGDFLFKQSSTLICWPDGSLDDYFVSLETLRQLVVTEGITTLYTGHGFTITDPIRAIDHQKVHRQKRLARVKQAALDAGTDDFDQILKNVYHGIDTKLTPAARRNVEAQLAYLREHGEL